MSLFSSKKINPEGNPNADIMLIGECPGKEEDISGRPFIGQSGDSLFSVLGRNNILREECYIDNVFPYRPNNNVFKSIKDTPELALHVESIKQHLATHKHKIVILLGDKPAKYIAGTQNAISDLQGFPFVRNGQLFIYSYHPAYILHSPPEYAVFEAGIQKAIRLSRTGWSPPELKLTLAGDDISYLEYCREILNDPEAVISVDIETVRNSFIITEIGIGLSEDEAITFSPSSSIIRTICDSPCKKVFQNGIFDISILAHNGYHVNNYYWDTHLAAQTLEPELPRDLYTLASFYSNLSFWYNKESTYNAKDCIATYQVYLNQEHIFRKRSHLLPNLAWKMECVELARHLSTTGQLVDLNNQAKINTVLQTKRYQAQSVLNHLAGRVVNTASNAENGHMQTLLYSELELPIKRDQKTGKMTTDDEALVELITFTKAKADEERNDNPLEGWKRKHYILKLCKILRGNDKLSSSYINAKRDSQDRLHSVYSPGATETNRWAAYKYYDNSGLNGMTFPREVMEL